MFIILFLLYARFARDQVEYTSGRLHLNTAVNVGIYMFICVCPVLSSCRNVEYNIIIMRIIS